MLSCCAASNRRGRIIDILMMILLTIGAFLLSLVNADIYEERLTIQPLPKNAVLTSFSFDISQQGNSTDYDLFPRSLGQILQETSVRELHLRFSQGWWDADNWGSAPAEGKYAGGIGVEVWAWIKGANVEDARVNWRRLVNSLSGLFCASLNFVDEAKTTYPINTFEPFGSLDGDSGDVYLMRGALPREPVCTENLTPFLKLLPCKGKAGISSVLDGHRLFDAQWQAMAIDIYPVPVSSSRHMTLTIDAVMDVPRCLARNKNPVPQPIPQHELRCDGTKPYSSMSHCFPLPETGQSMDWTISDVFGGKRIQGHCLLASNNDHVIVRAPESWRCSVVDYDKGIEGVTSSNVYQLGDVQHDIRLQTENSGVVLTPDVPPVFVERSFSGNGQERGGLRTVFVNPDFSNAVSFVYFESLPWYMRVYLHTLDVSVSDLDHETPLDVQVLKDVHYLSARDRKRPVQLEFELSIPPRSSISLTYEFDKSLLYIEEYPPDANRGFDIAPGVLRTIVDENDQRKSYSTRTTSLLLSLPTPDFSMPYNVIILTGTVMALTFGTVFNMLFKQTMSESEAETASKDKSLNKKLASLKHAIEQKLAFRGTGSSKQSS